MKDNKNATLITHSAAGIIQRLTALWAFSESALGGILHALKTPFTGLAVGGMAMIIITLIAHYSEKKATSIIPKSLIVVLLIKASLSPFTPFTAYIAVSFQAVAAIVLYRIWGVNKWSIAIFCVIAMLESALQKLLVLTFFFGTSFWKAIDELLKYIAQQLAFIPIETGSMYLIAVYIGIYAAGGLFIARLTLQLLQNLQEPLPHYTMQLNVVASQKPLLTENSKKTAVFQKTLLPVILMLFISLAVSVVLYYFSSDKKNTVSAVLYPFFRTVAALLLWYVLLFPVFRWLRRYGLQQQRSAHYTQEIEQALQLFPSLKNSSRLAWEQSGVQKKGKQIRLFIFVRLLIWYAITLE